MDKCYHDGYDYTIYISSSTPINSAYGYYGFIKYDNKRNIVYRNSGYAYHTTRERQATMYGLIVALYSTPLGSKINIVTESLSLYDGLGYKDKSRDKLSKTLLYGCEGRDIHIDYIPYVMNETNLLRCRDMARNSKRVDIFY